MKIVETPQRCELFVLKWRFHRNSYLEACWNLIHCSSMGTIIPSRSDTVHNLDILTKGILPFITCDTIPRHPQCTNCISSLLRTIRTIWTFTQGCAKFNMNSSPWKLWHHVEGLMQYRTTLWICRSSEGTLPIADYCEEDVRG